MKCIDVIEGTVKSILSNIQMLSIEDGVDDTEYVRMAKAVIDATDQFVEQNPELVDDPQLLKRVLYDFSRNLWLKSQLNTGNPSADGSEMTEAENTEYQTYYYDYLYHRGLYPR